MKKQIILSAFALLMLSACSTPNYGESLNKSEPVKDVTPATEVLSFNGYIVEVTEDNIIKVRIPKAGQLVESGLQVHDDEVIQVALAAIDTPLNNLPFGQEANTIIQALLPEGHEIRVDALPQLSVQSDKTPSKQTILEGIVYFDDMQENSIQSVLLQNGLALLDSKAIPYIAESEPYFNDLQEKAQNGELGVWAVDGLITLSQRAEAEFTKIGQFNEQQAKGIVEEFKARGWTAKEILKQYGVTIE